jgi:SAM-dependent methyltransferase
MTADADARARARAAAHAAIDAAGRALARGAIDERTWSRRVTRALSAAYLIDDDPRWQSGFDGDAALWREAREGVLDAVDRDGTLLDVGCATGHLMECLAAWGRERGVRVEPYGLELDPALAREARRRLPAWADRIFVGHAMDWPPPRRIAYVRTGVEYVPPGRGAALLARLHADVVAPGGRLIVGPVYGAAVDDSVAAFVAAGLGEPVARSRVDRNGKSRQILWVERSREG